MSDELDEAIVTYRVKELLAQIKSDQSAGFARIERGLESKASKEDLAEIRGELSRHGEEIDKLQESEARRVAAGEAHTSLLERQAQYRQWAIPTGLTIIYTIVIVLQALGTI